MRVLGRLGVAIALAVAAAWAYLVARSRRAERYDPWELAMPGARFHVRGVGVHFVEAGDPAHPALILIHGLGGSYFGFRDIIGPLSRRRHVLALDLPGHGHSDRPAAFDYALSAQASVVRELMDRLGIARADVVGHSLGGAVAMRLAIDAPGRVDHLVLMAAAVVPRMRAARPLAIAAVAASPALSGLLSHRRLRRMQLGTAYHDSAHLSDAMLDDVDMRAAMRGSSRVLGRVTRGLMSEPPPDPASVSQRTLILWGESDRWVRPEQGARLLAAIPHAELRLVPEAGHMLMEEQPKLVAQAIDDFLG